MPVLVVKEIDFLQILENLGVTMCYCINNRKKSNLQQNKNNIFQVSYEGQPTYPSAPSPGGGGGGYPSQRPSGPSFPTPSGSGQTYAPGGGYKY